MWIMDEGELYLSNQTYMERRIFGYEDMRFSFEIKYQETTMPRERTCCCSSLKKISAHRKPSGNKTHFCQNRRKTLVQTCFDTLAKNLDGYLAVFNDESFPKLHSEFLQLMSDRLMTALVTANDFVTLKQARFLINPCLKKLYLDVFHPADIDAILDKLKTTPIKIIELATGKNLSLEQVAKLVDVLPQTLKSLQLSKCSAVILKKVVHRCPALENLNLSNCDGVNDRCIQNLLKEDENGERSRNTVLQVLDIQKTNVSESGCRFVLENVPNLTAFCTPNLAQNCFLKFARGPYNLTSLIYGQYLLSSQPGLERDLMRSFIIYPYVTKLLVHYPLSPDGINACAVFENLEDAAFLSQFQCDISHFLKKRGSNLKSFMIEGYNVHVSLKLLSQYCPLLRTLRLINVILDDIEALADSRSSMRHVEDIVLQGVFFMLKTGLQIAVRHRQTLNISSPLLFKRSCFIDFEEFVDAIVRYTCSVDYLHIFPELPQMVYMAAPNISSVCVWVPHVPFSWP